MNDLQRLEDIEINKASINIDEIIKQMRSIGLSICQDKKFIFRDCISKEAQINHCRFFNNYKGI